MKHFETVEEFVSRSKAVTTMDELADCFHEAIREFGFDSFVLTLCTECEGLYVDVLALGSFPRIWHDYFVRENYFGRCEEKDVIDCQVLPYTWGPTTPRECTVIRGRRLFSDASEAGLSHGVSVPIHVSGRPSVVGSVAGSFFEIDPSVVSAVHLMTMYLYNAAVELHYDGVSASPAVCGEIFGHVKTLRDASTID